MIFLLQIGVRGQLSGLDGSLRIDLLLCLLLLLLSFFGIRIFAALLVILGGLDKLDLKLKDMSISRELQLHLLSRSIDKDSHIKEGCAELNRVDVVSALEHDLEAAFFVLK